jgi:abhydrolase domain-containing protein 14
MLVYGGKDGALGKTSHEDLRVIPNFQTKIIKDAGHACYIDEPDVFHILVYNFVRKIDSSVH